MSLKNDIYLNNNFMVYLLQLHINPFSEWHLAGHPCPMDTFSSLIPSSSGETRNNNGMARLAAPERHVSG